MDRVFFEQLELPETKHNLDVGSGSHAEQTGKMMMGIENVLEKELPDVVLVEGDTNTVLAGAIAGVKLGLKVGHVEAGLRSYDRRMPEEINRVLTDHCSDYLFAPTEKSRSILLGEGIPESRVFVTGNTIVDAVYQNLEIANRKRRILDELELEPRQYFVATVHRQENVDNPDRFSKILEGLREAAESFGCSVIYPIHPRSEKRIEEFKLNTNGIKTVQPLDFLSFLQLESNAKLVLTDSGGVQEEACILGVPCVTLRDNTERPETLEVNANILAGTNSSAIAEKVDLMLRRSRKWRNPFGDGKSAERIVQLLRQKHG